MPRTKLFQALTAACGLALSLYAGAAQAATCGVSGSASASPIVYDPFDPTGLQQANITLTLTRINTSGGGDTRHVNLYLKANSQTGTGADGTQIVPISSNLGGTTTGYGRNIFYNYNAPAPLGLLPATNLPTSSDFFHLDFTGNNTGSDTGIVTFRVTLPPNLNVQAIQSLAFDAYFSCNIQGGADNKKEQLGTISNAVTFPITVLSGLQTYYAGPALDFGDITTVPPTAPTGTAAVRTPSGSYVSVQASGAYSVEVSSQNGYRLKKPGATTVNDEVRYALDFLGYNRDSNSGTPGSQTIFRNCIRPANFGSGEQLPIRASLIEGGQGKNPSPSYSDLLTITITPLAYINTASDVCGSYTVP